MTKPLEQEKTARELPLKRKVFRCTNLSCLKMCIRVHKPRVCPHCGTGMVREQPSERSTK